MVIISTIQTGYETSEIPHLVTLPRHKIHQSRTLSVGFQLLFADSLFQRRDIVKTTQTFFEDRRIENMKMLHSKIVASFAVIICLITQCYSQNCPHVFVNNNKPRNLEVLLRSGVGQSGPVSVCEGNEVESVYDTQNGVPLYSATVLNKAQLTRTVYNRGGRWHDAAGWPTNMMLYNKWPSGTSRVPLKYQKAGGQFVDETRWKNAANNAPTASVHLGHLVASQYAKLSANTMTYQNMVPQFSASNQGGWKTCEMNFFKWAQSCYISNNQPNNDVKVYVLVGSVPSEVYNTYNPNQFPRYFGKGSPQGTAAFSDLYSPTSFAFNVPDALWTAACCVVKAPNGNIMTNKVKNTAFYLQNFPDGNSPHPPCTRIQVSNLFSSLGLQNNPMTGVGPNNVDLFPGVQACSNAGNYLQVP